MKQATENEKVSIGYYKNKGTIEYSIYIDYICIHAIRHLILLILVEYMDSKCLPIYFP